MTRTILAVFGSDVASAELYTSAFRRHHGYDVVPAMLAETRATEAIPHIDRVLQDCMAKGVKLNGILIHDSSFPTDSPMVQGLHRRWKEADDAQKAWDAEGKRFNVHVEMDGSDPAQNANRHIALEEEIHRAVQENVKSHREALGRTKRAVEDVLLRNAPSEKGVHLIHTLRQSPYRHVPIAVMAHEDKKQAFLQAGASQVVAWFEDFSGIEALTRAMEQKASAPNAGRAL